MYGEEGKRRRVRRKVRVNTRDNCDRNRKISRVTFFARYSTDIIVIYTQKIEILFIFILLFGCIYSQIVRVSLGISFIK